MPTRSERKVWRSLRRGKGREAVGRLLAEGPRLLDEALRAGRVPDVVLHAEAAHEDGRVRDLLEWAEKRGARVECVTPHLIAEISEARSPQAVVSIVAIPRWSWSDVPAGGCLVLLDGLQDPGNVGTLARTATALGAVAVVVLEGSADPWGPKALRASAGAGFRRPILRAGRRDTLAELERRAAHLWIADAAGEPLAPEEVRPEPLALALGSEAHGVSADLASAAERVVAVPMSPGSESLNVAAAGAILLDRLLSADR